MRRRCGGSLAHGCCWITPLFGILWRLRLKGAVMPTYEIAELNIGIFRGPFDSPIMADFVANLGRIYAMADASCGFAWRLQTDAGDATAIRPFENENIAINMSVWRDIESLLQFVYHSSHTEIMHRRGKWFERMGEDYM